MKSLVIIPARYGSSRFPGKPLAKVGGVEMITRVCNRVKEAGLDSLVATDDLRILQCVEKAGFNAIITSEDCKSGTERVAEAYSKIGIETDIVVNIQGDEPFIQGEQIKSVIDIFKKEPTAEIATLIKRYNSKSSYNGLADPNLVKVVISEKGKALYFSRSVIPYLRNKERELWPSSTEYYTHIGIYAYRADILKELVRLPETSLERAERLEQLRWLGNGYDIYTSISEYDTIGIDTPADLEAAEKYLKESVI